MADSTRTAGPEPRGFPIIPGDPVDLRDLDPRATPGYDDGKKDGAQLLVDRADELSELQERLFAAERREGGKRVLLVIQGMDTAGKGGIVRHVVGQVDPQGVHLASFKAPTEEEQRHDFLWRIRRELPGPGIIGVFDRSHYEDILIHRVHGWADEAEIARRIRAIRDFEQELTDGGTTIIKLMLHISRKEQGERLMERLERPDKHWKFAPSDIDERGHWEDYLDAYNAALHETSTDAAPWHVIPADRKWYARIAAQQLLLDALRGIDPPWPRADFDVDEQTARLRATLEEER